jgi:hypothetical protein
LASVRSLIAPFFSWKQAPGKAFAASSRKKYEPLLLELADWSDERDVASIATAELEFEYLPGWAALVRRT